MGMPLIALLLFTLLPSLSVFAEPATLPFNDCFDKDANSSQKLDVSTVYAQVLKNAQQQEYLNLTVLGSSDHDIIGSSNDSSNLATLFTTTTVLTLSAWTNSSYVCDTLRPPSSAAINQSTSNYCRIPAGPFALSATIPWGDNRALTTLTTRLRAVDPWSSEIMCVQVETTPLDPSSDDNPYGAAVPIFWATVALAIAYWLTVGIARIVSAWNRGISRNGGLWERARSAGYIVASAISGERLATSPALMRFCTPSMRDVIFHTQWCAALAMVAVQWPGFIYPILNQTSWATLVFNVTLTKGAQQHRWDPLSVEPYSPPSEFVDQLSDSSSVLYIDSSAPNTLFSLPSNASDGMASFAYTIGVRPRDLFDICLILFLGIAAATVALSLIVWSIDYLARLISSAVGKPTYAHRGTRSPAFASKEMIDASTVPLDENKSLNGGTTSPRPPSRFGLSGSGTTPTTRKPWWKVRTGLGSFHGSVLHGNLVRILVLFHLPVTIFSVYQMVLRRTDKSASLTSTVLAGFSFAVFSLIIPTLLVIRVRLTSTNKLYDETGTLLSLGPLYNHYRHGSQMFAALFFASNVAFGVTIGAGQRSGTAQAIVILVIEVVGALVTSVWLPWGTGASMGLISFLFCVARIVIAVLLVILTPAISIGGGAGAWVAYGILVILALVYFAQLLMLLVKLLEAVVRIIGGIGFDRSSHIVDSGLLGACGLLGCCGPRRRRRQGRHGGRGKSKASANKRVKRDSDLSSYVPPNALARDGGSSIKKGSVHSGPPPSVLRPEQALRPYREDSDDENGYIMGAWQPFPTNKSSGYIPVSDAAPTSAPTKSTGFSRVGGGRAHIDSPYAISGGGAGGSNVTFPSQTQPAATGSTSRLHDFDDEEVSLSANNAVRQQHQQIPSTSSTSGSGLPPGAMAPFHVRTRSQTAIIENYPTTPVVGSRPPSRANALEAGASVAPPSSYRRHSSANDDGYETEVPKKKWFQLRRHRPQSSEGAPSPPFSPAQKDEEAALGQTSQTTPGRSFVVIRKGQQQAQSSPSTPTRRSSTGP